MSYASSATMAMSRFFFFFNDTATTEIYTLSLHDALPICANQRRRLSRPAAKSLRDVRARAGRATTSAGRSEEHTSELQSRLHLVCRLLLEKKKKTGIVRRCCYMPCRWRLARGPHSAERHA